MSYIVGSNNSYKPITNMAWVRARLCKLQKRCTRLTTASDKVYQLLAHGWRFSSGTPASSTTKTGRHDIAEILLKVALKHQKSKSKESPGRKTNTNARKTTCTRLLHSGVSPSTVQQLSGHTNIASVNNYAVVSNDMQHEMSNISCGVQSNINIVNKASSTMSVLPLSDRSNYVSSFSFSHQVNETVTTSKQSCAQCSSHSFRITGNCTV